MNADKINAIAAKSADNLKHLFAEGTDAIAQAIAAAAEEAEHQGKESVVITLGHQIKLDLGKDSQTDTLSWSVKHKLDACSQIPDPNQPELPMNPLKPLVDAMEPGDSLEISGGGKTVKIAKPKQPATA